MGPDQLSSVMQTVSGKKNTTSESGEDRFKQLRDRIEGQSTAIYSTARIWVCRVPLQGAQGVDNMQDDGIIAPADTRDVLGLGLELVADERASRGGAGPGGTGSRGEIGADGDAGDWGVFRM